MQIIPSLLFGISASLDALLIGISYGIRSIRIHLWQNLLVSGITLAGTCLSVGFGSWLTPKLPHTFCRYAGSMVLMLLGVWYVVKWLVKKLAHEREITQAARPIPQLSFPEVLGLGVSLSLNNIGIGLSASIAGLTLFPAAAATLACSLLFLFAGNRLGRSRFLQFLGAAADPVSGTLLILLSLLQAFL